VARQEASIQQLANQLVQQVSLHNDQMRQFQAVNDVLLTMVKGLTVTQERDQRRIADLEAKIREADRQDDSRFAGKARGSGRST
jgi:cell division protein ZapA (FtsZ GTPase activity inhibitor)